jgi:DNA-directed RNA polymerase beta' subunit
MSSSLTSEEKKYILDVIPTEKFIPLEIANSMKENILNDLSIQLDGVTLRDKISKKHRVKFVEAMRSTILHRFYKCKIESGSMPGAVAGQSIGQPVTQSTLNSFHYSGVASARSMVMGVKKFLELLNATKNPSSSTCTIYYNSNKCHSSISSVRECMGNSLIYIKLGKLVNRHEINFKIHTNPDVSKRWWFVAYTELYDRDVIFYDYSIRVYLSPEKMYKYRITPKEIVKKMNDCGYYDVSFIASPLDECIIDIFVDTQVVTDTDLGSGLIFPNNDNKIKIYLTNVVWHNMSSVHVCGIVGIEEVYYSKNQKTNEWFIETEGSNFRELMNIKSINDGDDIDYKRLRTNNMWEVLDILGIEAARKFLIDEITNFISFDGTYIDHHHVDILVDSMTFNGSITSVSRYGINRSVGPLAKASFEESMENLLKAGIYGETESTEGVSGSVIMGKFAKIGTETISLFVDDEKYKSIPYSSHIDEETDISKIFSIDDSYIDEHSLTDSDEEEDESIHIKEDKLINPMSFSLYNGDAIHPQISDATTSQLHPKPIFLNNLVREH